ncbi:release factor glutamine methyltransferase [Allopseudospirillum japonicum]|uniref:Release factor glutamine methyltransferase n=1 Tax=Allopseudospirillum japonicum TaxID=64971 RepID=A0A1H6S9M3_9GAMM|nr:peptide chain release factor N(5)-glutamine methyltransferase [Allopseudospirillum japonicum]SEI60122.1 release factor glutamine methyltransferase [Allopseudospirillum japonicum]
MTPSTAPIFTQTPTCIEQALTWASQALAPISPSAHLDASLLLAHLLNKPSVWLYTWPEKPVPQVVLQPLRLLLARRLQGEPLAYLLGYQEFWGLRLSVSPATLIPRPDTETLVEAALSLPLPSQARVLDLGTGTGAIALALASERPHWQIHGVDQAADAVALARHNAQSLQLAVTFTQSDWFTQLDGQAPWDLIVSNPPYIDAQDPHLHGLGVKYEPASALIAANHGLADLQHLVNTAADHLPTGGYLLLEHGHQQAQAVAALFTQAKLWQNIQHWQDLAGHVRITGAQKQ